MATRLTVEFGDDVTAELEKLSKTLQAKKVEVIRNALGLYSYVVHSIRTGKVELALVSNDEVEKIIVVPGVFPPREEATARKKGEPEIVSK